MIWIILGAGGMVVLLLVIASSNNERIKEVSKRAGSIEFDTWMLDAEQEKLRKRINSRINELDTARLKQIKDLGIKLKVVNRDIDLIEGKLSEMERTLALMRSLLEMKEVKNSGVKTTGDWERV